MNIKNQIIWINPNEIKGLGRRGTVLYPRNGLSKSDYMDAALWIQRYKLYKDSGIPDEKLLEIVPMKQAVRIFLNNLVRVSQINGQYYLGDDGRHRVKAAQDCRECNLIPVLLVEKYDMGS